MRRLLLGCGLSYFRFKGTHALYELQIYFVMPLPLSS
jgi:hypothetical protein